MKFLTFIIALPGSAGHQYMKGVMTGDEYIQYADTKHRSDKNQKLYEEFQAHPSYLFPDLEPWPRIFKPDENVSETNIILNELYDKYQKKIARVVHMPPSIVRDRYPESEIHVLLPRHKNVKHYQKRWDKFKKLHGTKYDHHLCELFHVMHQEKKHANVICNL